MNYRQKEFEHGIIHVCDTDERIHNQRRPRTNANTGSIVHVCDADERIQNQRRDIFTTDQTHYIACHSRND